MTRLVAFALLSAALMSAAHRPWGPGWIALAAYLPLLYVLSGERSAWRGALAGGIASLGTGLVAFEGVVAAVPWAYPLLAFVAGVWMALAGAGYVLIARLAGLTAALWSFPALWIAAEYLPAQRALFGDFANGMSAAGYTQFDTPFMVLAPWSGVSGVSLAVLMANVALFALLRRRGVAPALAVLAAVAIAPVLPVPGVAPAGGQEPPLRIGIAQGAVSSAASLMARFDRAAAQRMIEPYAELTAQAAERGADLVVWGETAIPQAVRPGHVPDYLADALAPAPLALVGGVSYREGRSYNAVFHWREGTLREAYRKRALVPINEARYTAGEAVPPLEVGGHAAGLGICLDSVFGSLGRSSVSDGAEILIYVTEDSFAGTTVTPELHLRVTAFRAAETARATVFASQSGPSAVFDPRGTVVRRLPHGSATGTVAPVRPHRGFTPYVRLGDWVGGLAIVVVLAWWVTGGVSLAGRLAGRDAPAPAGDDAATPR